MSPLEKLKAGIIEGDWNTVAEGYAELTGELLPAPDGTAPDKEDGDEENHVDVVAAAGESGRKTVYGNTQAFVTAEGEPPPEQVARNRTRAGRTCKQHRGKPEVHHQACTQCGEAFEVPVRTPKDVGQRCPKCLAGVPRERA